MIKFISSFLDLIYPKECILCAQAGTYLCPSCMCAIDWIKGPCCLHCGGPFYGCTQENRICSNCFDLKPSFQNGKSAFLLQGNGRALVHEIKYRNGRFLKQELGDMIQNTKGFLDFIEGSILVPVPLHSRKQRERGFNQSEWIAHIMASLGRSVQVKDILCRIVDTETQTDKNKRARLKNVKNAFALKREISQDAQNRFIIVDDVFTTGATLNACSLVLKKAGCARIDVIALAHG